jgi:bifunctional DNase/RNase
MMAMRIKSLVMCSKHKRPLLSLVDREGGQWQLTLWLPGNEADRLARVLGLTGHRCVAVFDLVQTLLRELDARVSAVVLDADHEGVGAMLRLDRAGTELVVPYHPADGLALAELTGAPIHATPATMQHARLVSAEPRADLNAWLERVRPGDFGTKSSGPSRDIGE